MSETLSIDICVCTFRRPHLADTLRSISKLLLNPTWRVNIIVADNDDTPSAKEMTESVARETSLPVLYIHAPARNISIARNACLNKATGDLLAFVDDDEMVTPEWLEAMITTYQQTNTEVVLGRVRAEYESNCPDWMRNGDFHSTKPTWVNGQIITGYTCNVLFNRTAKSIAGLRFRADLGRTGGEDTVFFSTIYKAGGRISYAPEALVTEVVPANRANLLWLVKRRYRSGQTHALLLLEASGFGLLHRIENIAMAKGKALLCFVMALPNATHPERLRFWLLRAALHVGVISRLLGKKIIEPYS